MIHARSHGRLAFNNRPLSSHTLVRSFLHFVSFIVFALGWLGQFHSKLLPKNTVFNFPSQLLSSCWDRSFHLNAILTPTPMVWYMSGARWHPLHSAVLSYSSYFVSHLSNIYLVQYDKTSSGSSAALVVYLAARKADAGLAANVSHNDVELASPSA